MELDIIRMQFSSANDGQWGAETTDEEALLLAKNCCWLAEAYAASILPEGTILEATVTSWPAPINDRDPLIDMVHEYIGRHWCEEALWTKDFDALAYVKANPR